MDHFCVCVCVEMLLGIPTKNVSLNVHTNFFHFEIYFKKASSANLMAQELGDSVCLQISGANQCLLLPWANSCRYHHFKPVQQQEALFA